MAAAQVPKASEWCDEVSTAVIDRFERRLSVEIGAVRVDVSRELATLRFDVARDLSALRVELLKWSFFFWIGQVATIAGLLAFMLQR